MRTFKQFLLESDQTMTLWHGGNLEHATSDYINHKKGKWEYGPGLYLTTHYHTALTYAKGSRKLYRITIHKGTNISEVHIPVEKAFGFIDNYVIRNKTREIKEKLNRWIQNNSIPANIFSNVIINGAMKNTNNHIFRKFLVDNGVDYELVPNAFGWHEMMVVLFNMDLIIRKEVINSKTPIEIYDLPPEFSNSDK